MVKLDTQHMSKKHRRGICCFIYAVIPFESVRDQVVIVLNFALNPSKSRHLRGGYAKSIPFAEFL